MIMLDNILSQNKEYLLLEDFNISLIFPRHRWNSTVSSFHLQQAESLLIHSLY